MYQWDLQSYGILSCIQERVLKQSSFITSLRLHKNSIYMVEVNLTYERICRQILATVQSTLKIHESTECGLALSSVEGDCEGNFSLFHFSLF